MKKLYKATEFAKIVGLSIMTINRRIADGTLKPIVINTHRYFNDDHVAVFCKEITDQLPAPVPKQKIAYYRVSSQSQKKELVHQREFIENFVSAKGIIVDEYISDIGSGINFNRKGLIKILELIEKELIDEIFITYKDRLCRFAYDLIEGLAIKHNVKITIINIETTSPEKELIDDLMSLIHVFSARLYGIRSYSTKIKKILNIKEGDIDEESSSGTDK